MKLPALLLFAACLCGGAIVAHAGKIYTWRDASGHVHYSDTPPPDQAAAVYRNATVPSARPAEGNPTADGTKPTPPNDPDAAFRQRRKEAAEAQAKADKEHQEAEARRQNCEAMRGQLAGLRSGERMARYTSDGERVVIDDQTREAEIARLQKAVDSGCP